MRSEKEVLRPVSAKEDFCVGRMIAFVVGPYRDSRGPNYIRENIERAREVAVELWKMGFVVLCPHMNTALMDGICPDEVFLEGGKELLRRAADFVVVLPGWRDSIGSVGELVAAQLAGIDVFNWPEDRNELAKMTAGW